MLINDIGLIRVDRDIEFNQKVQQVKLAKDDIAKADYPVVLSGWGRLTVKLSQYYCIIKSRISDDIIKLKSILSKGQRQDTKQLARNRFKGH